MEQIIKFNLSKYSQVNEETPISNSQQAVSTFNIPAKIFYFFQRKVEELNKRAQKIGIPGIQYEVLGKKTLPSNATRPKETMIYEIKVTGIVPKVEGWSFVASVHHAIDDSGQYGNIVSSIPSYEDKIPQKYWKQEPICEHCNTKRRRSDTFLLQNDETGEFKQCGRNCLADFLRTNNIDDIMRASALLAINQEIAMMGSEDFDEFEGFGRGGRRSYPLLNVLALTKHIVSQIGYVPTRSETNTSTKEIVLLAMNLRGNKDLQGFLSNNKLTSIETEAEDYEIADESIQWVKNLSDKDVTDNPYLSNIKSLVNSSFIDPKFFGLAVSIIPSYLRQRDRIRREQTLKRLREEKGNINPYVGKLKEQIEFTVKIDKIKGPFRGGESMLFMGTTEDYQVVKWWGKPSDSFKENETYRVIGIPISQAIDQYEKSEVTELSNVILASENKGDRMGSQFIGVIDVDGNGKMDNFQLTLIDKKGPFQSSISYGRRAPELYEIYIFQDDSGRKAKWSGPTGKYRMDIGGKYSVRAKPKNHEPNDRYEKGPVTILTQVRDIQELVAPPEAVKHVSPQTQPSEKTNIKMLQNDDLFKKYFIEKLGHPLSALEESYFKPFAKVWNDQNQMETLERQCTTMDISKDVPEYLRRLCDFFKILVLAAKTFN